VLYRREAFEPLTDEAWDETRVREAIRRIVEDADEQLRGPRLLWPADDWDGWRSTSPMKNLYVGAAGVLWALDQLRKRGHAETRLNLPDLAEQTLELFRARPDFMKGMKLPVPRDSALFEGETGILLVVWRLAPSQELADSLYTRVRANIGNEANELMWGAPGTMLAARALLDWTGEERWADVWRESAEELWRRREPDGLWTQHLYGQEHRSLGPPHGLVGNVLALLGGGTLLGAERRRELQQGTDEALARSAVVEDGFANWPGPDAGFRLQWCAGAPGIVSSAAEYLDEQLLLAGAELTWRAGPPGMEKGAGLCHGTAGSGYAFLKAFERTRDECWLERARRFAVHALGQVERWRRRRGRGRYSLWTGDVGAGLFAADCLDRRALVPIVDYCD
jgi:lantibiotic modifying enzyme